MIGDCTRSALMTCRATGGFGWSPLNSASSVGSAPWLNLCGQWGGDTFYAGGDLDCVGAQIGRVQLTLSDGSQLQDDGVGNVSLFIGRRGAPPDYVEIFAPDGALLSKQP